jgi:hypothetical protein
MYKINQYFVVTKSFYSEKSLFIKIQISTKVRMLNIMEADRLRALAAISWQQTAIDKGEAVKRVQCSQ